MSEIFNFSVHGVAVIPEFSLANTGNANGMVLRRTGNGAIIRQSNGTNNWFHFALPSTTRLDGDPSKLLSVKVTFLLNQFARVDHFNVHVVDPGHDQPTGNNPPRREKNPTSGTIYNSSRENPDRFPRRLVTNGQRFVGYEASWASRDGDGGLSIKGPVVASVNVFFEGDPDSSTLGDITFFSAHAVFAEQ